MDAWLLRQFEETAIEARAYRLARMFPKEVVAAATPEMIAAAERALDRDRYVMDEEYLRRAPHEV